MRHLLAASRLLCAALPLLGCSASLDFDSVSSGNKPVVEPDLPDGGAEAFTCADYAEQVTFCDDFDGATPDLLWSDLFTFPEDGDAAIKSDSLDPLSGTTALVASVPGGFPIGEYVAATALKNFDGFDEVPFAGVISFDMKVDDFDPENKARISAFQFLFGNATKYNQLVLNLESRTTSIAFQFTENVGPVNEDWRSDFKLFPGTDTWVHVVFEIDVVAPTGGSGNRVSLRVDDVTVFDGELHLDLLGTQPRMELGIPWVETERETQPWRVRYDNVLVVLERK
jgi:hypothetical protein